MPLVDRPRSGAYDLVVIGSGFGSLFFLHKYLQLHPRHKILILERGGLNTHAWQLAAGRNSSLRAGTTYRSPEGHKPWNFTIGWGGGMNCWWAQTPRWHPSDFRTRTLYGVGTDWPFGYDDLEPFYAEAESIMSVAGDEAMSAILPRSIPFPQPSHRLSTADEMMRAAQPDLHVPMATARASRTTAGRGRCCATATCNLCPVDAKFTAFNGFASVLEDARIDVMVGAEVTRLEHESDLVKSAVVMAGGNELAATGDLFVLGANAIHSPAILMRSGIPQPETGVGIHEQVGIDVEVMLDGLDHFDGGSATTGLNYSLYDGDFRKQHAGVLIYLENRWKHGLRKEHERYRQVLPLTIVSEDLPSDANRVEIDTEGFPIVHHASPSEYALAGLRAALGELPRVLSPLPVERIEQRGWRKTESHIQGTLRMGDDPAHSVVDARQIHHKVRNLAVVGSSVFPSCSCANPSLTVAATSLRSATKMLT